MKRLILSTLALVSGFCLLSSISYAAPFEELFKIEKITGECMVQTPDNAEFVNAVDGNAYAYGTKIKTGRKSSAVIVFSEGNTCRVLANAVLAITRDTKDEKLKSINLDTGKVEVSLDPEFHKTHNDSLNVVTPTAICGAIGCKFSMDSRIEEDLYVVIVICDDGQIKVFGKGFDAPMDTEDGMTMSSARDGSFMRLKNIKGSIVVQVRDSEGNPKNVEMKVGSVVKIWRSKSATGKVWIVTILITSPDGTLEEAITYNEAMGEGEEGTSETPPGSTTTTTQPDTGDIITTTTTTTSTTTTTTIPPNLVAPGHTETTISTGGSGGRDSVTPVGRR